MNKERLQKLANHLIYEKTNVKFDFARFLIEDKEASCGFAGCALGECPFLFPEDWMVFDCENKADHFKNWRFAPMLKDLEIEAKTSKFSLVSLSILSAREFFQLEDDDVSCLFTIGFTISRKMEPMWSDSTPTEVGRNILKFIELKEQGII